MRRVCTRRCVTYLPFRIVPSVNGPPESIGHRAIRGLAHVHQGSVGHILEMRPPSSILIAIYRLNMRTTMSIYRQLGRWLESVDAAYTASHSQNSDRAQATTGLSPRGLMEDPSVDCHFRSGVYLGLGMSHLALSLMPARLVTIVEMFGYRADRMEGLRYLEWPGGWSRGRAEDVVSQGQFMPYPLCEISCYVVLSIPNCRGRRCSSSLLRHDAAHLPPCTIYVHF